MRRFRVTVNGQTFEVEVEEQSGPVRGPAPPPAPASLTPAPVVGGGIPAPGTDKPAAAPPRSGTGHAVTAPMPGVINALKVKEGDQVAAGDVLLILEAMKMENEITAPAAGVVRQITVSAGRSVGTGETMMVIG